MSREDHPHHPAVEQSWIVLDESGWASSRPPTASPSRRSARFDDDDETEEDDNSSLRRIGMDRDVREALEAAERSLQVAGTADEFGRSSAERPFSDDEEEPMASSFARNSLSSATGEDRYNGRGDPTVRGNHPRIVLSMDTEHVAFRKLRAEQDTPRALTPPVRAPIEPPAVEDVPSTPNVIRVQTGPPSVKPNTELRLQSEHPRTSDDSSKEDDSDKSLLQWILGIYGGSNFTPLLLSHAVTLVIGLYLGTRKSSNASGAQASSGTTSATSNGLVISEK